MSFWKIMSGIVVGVGAVAAAPFTGGGSVLAGASLIASLAGTGAIAAAVAAGTTGAVIGAMMSDSDKEEGKREGERVATAKYKEKVEKLVAELKQQALTLKDDKEFFQNMIAMFAVGMATANADGNISQEELHQVEEFIAGLSGSNLPSHIKDIIIKYKTTPPTFNTAMELVKELENPNMNLFESIIEVVSMSDGKTTEEELAFLAAFRQSKQSVA